MSGILAWVASHRHRGMVAVAALTMMPFLGILASGLLAFLSLVKGLKEGLFVAAGAALVLLVTAALLSGAASPAAIAGTVAVLWGPVFGLAWLQQRFDSLGLVFQILALVGCLFLVLWYGISTDPVLQVADELKPAMEAMAAMGLTVDTELLARVMRIMPGVMVSLMALGYFFGLLLGCWWKDLFTVRDEMRRQFRRLSLGRFLSGLALATLVGALMLDWLPLANVVSMLAPFFILQGMALCHFLVAERGVHWVILAAMYVSLLFAPVLGMPLLGAVGYLDNWLGFRNRIDSQGAA